ncbi:MAG TPA: CoA ester lyase [Ramlibacter sp.]|jgi:citrate lyase subunit beta/citryl-CoA lyase
MAGAAITYLFVPGDRPERFAKALAAGADVVVIDLEDAVSPDRKEAARGNVAEALAQGDRQACVRINAVDTPWFEQDLGILSLPGVASVMVPKAETSAALAAIRAAAPRLAIIPIVETARGLAHAAELAAGENVQRLAFGSVDFQVDLGIEGEDMELLFARSQLVLASRLAGIMAPVDGVTVDVKDAARATSDSARARRLGFGGKLCIHPSQLTPVRQAFLPDAESVRWAAGVLQAAESSGAGALTFEGKMVDKPVLDRARSIIARAS